MKYNYSTIKNYICLYTQNDMNTLPIIANNRITLRPLSLEDTNALFSYFSQDKVMIYYDLPTFSSPKEAEDLINTWNLRRQKGEGYRWGIILNEAQDNIVIGTCGFHNISTEHNKTEIGYELHPTHWGKGLATDACRLLVQYGLQTMNFHRIEAFIDPEHEASRKVLYKCGLETEGVLRDYFFEKGRFVDAEILSIIKYE